MEKTLKIVKYSLIAIAVTTVLLLFLVSEERAVDVMLVWGYVVLGGASLLAVVLSIYSLIRNPKSARRTVIGVGVVALAAITCFALSSPEQIALSDNSVVDSPAILRLTDTELYVAYFMLALTIGVALFSEIKSNLK